jgi:hypothetical protein
MFADNPSWDEQSSRSFELEFQGNVHTGTAFNQQQMPQTSAPTPSQVQAPPVVPATTAPLTKKEIPICKYFLKGACLIRNCPYRHTTQVACKFFLQGFCMRGKECDFIHTYDMSSMSEVFANISLEMSNEGILSIINHTY